MAGVTRTAPCPRPVRSLTRARLPVAGMLLATALAAGCSGDPAPAAAPAPSTAPPRAGSSAPVALADPLVPSPSAPSPGPARDPLTGRAPVPSGSVVAVKIDNSPLARPFTRGLGDASLVYQELMEGGATRFMAVYAPATGKEVGPIRSVREGDVELVQQFGTIPLGASGGNAGVLATVAQAAREGKLLDASFDVLPGPYRKGERRRDAFNFFTSPEKLAQASPSGSAPKDIGLRFGPLPATAGFPAAGAAISFSETSRVRVAYDAAGGRYAVFQDGDRMRDFAPANVVVQHVQIRPSKYVDVLGNATPCTGTVGEGPVAILRDGRRVSGTWRRLAPRTGTRYLDDRGRDLPLRPGVTLVLLVPAGMPLQVG